MDATSLKEIANLVTVCRACKLAATRKKAVPGEGPDSIEVMMIGEGPGFHENESGRPFVGQAGKLLDDLLDQAGLQRKDVFITNVVKCRPPNNRDPEPDELMACSAYLNEQIHLLDPLVIVTLGRYSMARFMPYERISAIHGKARWIGERMIVSMYHPAAALHQPALMRSVREDFARLSEHLKSARDRASSRRLPLKAKEEPSEPAHPTQLTLF